MNNADEIRKQLQAAKDALLSEVMTRSDKGAFTPMINKMAGDVRELERQLVEMENVKIKKVLIHDIPVGSLYYLQVKRGYERDFLAHNFIHGFIPVE